VQADKDREYYLGHSVKALTGRWQKGKDVYWYTREERDKQPAGAYESELAAVKAHEEQLMAEALGIKPKTSHAQQRKLDEVEMKQLLRRNGSGAEAGPAGGSDEEEDPRGKGLGYKPCAATAALCQSIATLLMPTVGSRVQRFSCRVPAPIANTLRCMWPAFCSNEASARGSDRVLMYRSSCTHHAQERDGRRVNSCQAGGLRRVASTPCRTACRHAACRASIAASTH
jgi:Multiple myeloma tumor-associated